MKFFLRIVIAWLALINTYAGCRWQHFAMAMTPVLWVTADPIDCQANGQAFVCYIPGTFIVGSTVSDGLHHTWMRTR